MNPVVNSREVHWGDAHERMSDSGKEGENGKDRRMLYGEEKGRF